MMDCEDYDFSEAVILMNDNLSVDGKYVYAPIYMSMFIVKTETSGHTYHVDLSGLK